MKRLLILSPILFLLPFFGCATTVSTAASVDTSNVDYPKAEKLLWEALDNADDLWGWKVEYKVSDVELVPSGIEITGQRQMISSLGPVVHCRIEYAKLKDLEVLANGSYTTYHVWPLETGCENLFPHWSFGNASHFAHDFLTGLLAMQRLGPEAAAEYERKEAERHAQYEKFKAMKPKPPLPEEARRFKVQAEAAFDEKQYERAAGYYAQGLDIAPWWPDGHFNRALMLEQLGRFEEATDEMKTFLELAPDHPQARKGQDMIYVWESKIEGVAPGQESAVKHKKHRK